MTVPIILVIYLNIDGMDTKAAEEFVAKAKKAIHLPKSLENKVLHYFVPVRNQTTRIERL